MTRSINVFTLNNIDEIRKAMVELQSTGELLPQGSTVQVYLNNDKQVSDKLPGSFFGDIVQIIDFPEEWQAAEWETSEAYEDQRRRCRGLFSSTTILSFPLEKKS